MLSRTSRLALRAAAFLAGVAPDDRPTPVAVIADALGEPRNYLSKILHQLAKRGVLSSVRGPSGGFSVSADPTEIKLIEVVDPAESVFAERECLLGQAVCSDASPCSAHDHWSELNDALKTFLEETTLADLASHGGARSR